MQKGHRLSNEIMNVESPKKHCQIVLDYEGLIK